MTQFIVLRDRSGNWKRPEVPVFAQNSPLDETGQAEPSIETIDLTPAELRDLGRSPEFLSLAPVMPTRLIGSEPQDDLRAEETVPGWGLRAVGADRTRFSGQGVRIALLDTGVDTSQKAFAGVNVTELDFAGSGVDDANGHGTHLAGTILGRDLGGTRIGIARGVDRLFAAKSVADDGRGTSDSFLRAFLWSLRERADIVAFALRFDVEAHVEQLAAAGYPHSLAMAQAVHAYRGNLRIFETVLRMVSQQQQAPLVLAAVGNDSLRTISPDFETGPATPSAARGVLAVGALRQGERALDVAAFSNASPALAAPGVGILSAAPGGTVRSLNGTSMAMAHAAGVAALWIEALRDEGLAISAQTVADRLIRNATWSGLKPELSRLDCGAGLIQAPVWHMG